MNINKLRYIWITLLISVLVVSAGFFYVQWSKSGAGAGLYSRLWTPEAIFSYWDPDNFYDSVNSMQGQFKGEECVACHTAITPGIVNDWHASRHSQPANGKPKVYCSDCHGSNHQDLHMPTPKVCSRCHAVQHNQFVDERRYGFPSHALAMERAQDAKHFVDKPKAEVTSCIQCHSVASKCDSCHSRHRFNAAEARRPEACITCHSGPPHPDDETYFASKHGQIYLQEGQQWDWSKPLTKGNYKSPTCAYCHMRNGKHQVADKTIWKFGIKEVNPLTSGNKVRRNEWVEVCSDCHAADWSRQQLGLLDKERKQAWHKLYEAESVLKGLRGDGLLYPAAGERPTYPNDTFDQWLPYARIGFYEGQASAFFNVSPIERDYFEMWYFANLGAYKGAAHGDAGYVRKGHKDMDKALADIKRKAKDLRRQGQDGPRVTPGLLWFRGEYTEYNKEHN